jgi:hypothetical protein
MLRQLAQYHAKDPNNLFMVRIAQGLTHLGKGTLTLSPYHSDRQLMSPVAVAGLLATIVAFLDVKNSEESKFLCVFEPVVMLALFFSHSGPIPLSPLHTGHCDATPNVGHLR